MLDAGVKVTSYVAIRSDEEFREGYSTKRENLTVRLPFKEAGIDKARRLGNSGRFRPRPSKIL